MGPAKCEKHGMIRMVRTLPTYMPIMKYVKTIYGKDFVKMIGNLDDYVCTIPERRTLLNPYLHRKNRKFVPVADAEQGKFIIVFNVEDKAGNKANHVYRTVIVKDTLPPSSPSTSRTSSSTLPAPPSAPTASTPPRTTASTPRAPTARTPVAPPVPTAASATLTCRTASSWPKPPPPTAGSSAPWLPPLPALPSSASPPASPPWLPFPSKYRPEPSASTGHASCLAQMKAIYVL